jgi:hypothetical protein
MIMVKGYEQVAKWILAALQGLCCVATWQNATVLQISHLIAGGFAYY